MGKKASYPYCYLSYRKLRALVRIFCIFQKRFPIYPPVLGEKEKFFYLTAGEKNYIIKTNDIKGAGL